MRISLARMAAAAILIAASAAAAPAAGGTATASAAPGTIATLAGTGQPGDSGDGGQAAQAGVSAPESVATDAAGDTYVLDDLGSTIRRITPAGVISTFAGGGTSTADGVGATTAALAASAIASDASGNVLVADEFHYRIRRIDPATGVITTIAGTGSKGESGDGGPAAAAGLDDLSAIAVGPDGSIYVGDDNRVRRIDGRTGIITTVAGDGSVGGAMGDGGPATAASIPFIWGLALTPEGDIYIASGGCDCIRKVTAATGDISIAVNANALTDVPAVTQAQKASIQAPGQMASDSAGNVYVTSGLAAFNEVGRLDSSGSTFTVLAGSGPAGFSGDGGPATAAELDSPHGAAVTSGGALVIADMINNRVRVVDGAAPAGGESPGPPAPAPGSPAVTAITAPAITADTPLYDIPLALSLSGGSCPATVSVTLGSLPAQAEPVCGPGGQVPARLEVLLRPWDPADPQQALTPRRPVTATAGTASATVTIPPAPVWVGEGDSYASGYNQTSSHWNPVTCAIITYPQNKCGLTWDDYSFAWETRAVRDINQALAVPAPWLMTPHIVARSGASTNDFAARQTPPADGFLAGARGSWNVASVTGGADTGGGPGFTFDDAVQDWYENAFSQGALRQGIWTASALNPATGCPDTEEVYRTARAARAAITSGLAGALSAAWAADPAVRLVDVGYPYVLPKGSSCAKGGGIFLSRHGIVVNRHGATAVINMLDAAHGGVPAAVRSKTAPSVHVIEVDPRDPQSIFGSVPDPRKLLQLTAYYGYPHPNAAGQEDLASMAVGPLTGS